MPDLDKILLTALFGIFVFVLGQIVVKFLIEPLYEYRKVVSSIASALLYHAHYYSDSGLHNVELAEVKEAADQFRQLATELTARTVAIPGYRLLGMLRIVRPYKEILAARGSLWGLSNTLHRPDWERKMQLAREAANALKLTAIEPGLFGPQS